MIKIYQKLTAEEKVQEINDIKKDSWIALTNPTEDEINMVCKRLEISDIFIKSMLDEEEQAHIDKEGTQQLIVVDVPFQETKRHHLIINTSPLGIMIVKNETEEFILTVSLNECSLLEDFKIGKIKEFYTNKKSRFSIQIMLAVSQLYIKNLKLLDKETEKIEEKLYEATKNKNLLQLLNLQKSLVYVSAALSSNQAVLERLVTGNNIPLFDEDMALLDDTMIENRQAIEMAKIYSGIINGMTDAFATIISNNLNSIMKLLAGLTIVISIPTMIASFLGMNVPLGILSQNQFAFLVVILVSIVLSIIVAYFLKKKDML